VLSAAGVRRELLYAAGQAGVLAGGRRRVAAGLVDRVLEWLNDRSLLAFSMDGQTVILHRLVARVVRNELASSDMLTAMCEAAALALDVYSRALVGSQDRRAVRGIPQQVTALLDITAGPAAEVGEELAEILLRLRFIAFYHVLELGDSTPLAIAVGEPLTADLERQLGPDHPDTLNSRNSLAAAYLSAGLVAEAIQLFEQTLMARQRMLGPNHPETLTSRNNLASAYQDAGRNTEAIRLYELNLEIRKRLLGVGHPSTLNSRGNLAAAYLSAGRPAEAIPLLEQTLDGRQRVLGPHHPDTRTSRKNLAKAYRAAGRPAEAIPLEQALGGQERVLHPDRPRTATSRRSLAGAARHGGRVARAIPAAEPTLVARKSQPPAGAAEQLVPVGFRRPPADPARRVFPADFRRPPADRLRQPLPDRLESPAAKLTGRTSSISTLDASPRNDQYDREVVAAITAGNPAGMAMAYDKYAASLYGYCHGMLPDSAAAAAALQDTFVVAAATLGDLSEPGTLRPWLFARARNECRRRIQTSPATRDDGARPVKQRPDATGQLTAAPDRLVGATAPFHAVSQSADATMQFRVVSGPPDATMPISVIGGPIGATDGPAHVNGDPGQAQLRTLIYSILAELRPREREVIELSSRHDLHDNDLAIALGVSSRRANALASRAHVRLEKGLVSLRIALTRQQACPGLRELLADWDGRLTEEIGDLIGWHIEQCQACASYGQGRPRPAPFSRLLPLAPLPSELREQVLNRCCSTTEEAVAYRRRLARRADPTWFARFSQAIGQVSWGSIRANPGMAIATAAVLAWVVVAVTVTLLVFAGSHAAHAQVTQPRVRTSPSSPAAVATAADTPTTAVAAPAAAAATLSPAVVQPVYVPSPVAN
jgi:RNA polymerase sigma factor (sigma-70 family)